MTSLLKAGEGSELRKCLCSIDKHFLLEIWDCYGLWLKIKTECTMFTFICVWYSQWIIGCSLPGSWPADRVVHVFLTISLSDRRHIWRIKSVRSEVLNKRGIITCSWAQWFSIGRNSRRNFVVIQGVLTSTWLRAKIFFFNCKESLPEIVIVLKRSAHVMRNPDLSLVTSDISSHPIGCQEWHLR